MRAEMKSSHGSAKLLDTGWRDRIRHFSAHGKLGLWLLLGIYLGYLLIRSQRGWSDAAYWCSGLEQAHRGNWAGIYDPRVNPFAMKGFSPVFLYIVMYPLGYLTESGVRLVIAVGILGVWALAWKLMASALEGDAASPSETRPNGPLPGLIVCQRFLRSDLLANQINSLTFGPACFGLALMLKRTWSRTLLGGALLGATAGMKLFPLALIGLLWIKRAWREAIVATSLAAAALWIAPYLVLGPAEFDRVKKQQAASAGSRLWLHDASHELWGLPNFLYYRCYVRPWWEPMRRLPETAFQLAMTVAVGGLGLWLLPVLIRTRWSETRPDQLLADVAVVGVAICLMDPVGRTAHFIMAAPAHCVLLAGWINAWRNDRRRLPAAWRIAAYVFVLFANNFLLLSFPGVRHDWYMHWGLFPAGMATLLVLIRSHILDEHRRPVVALTVPSAGSLHRRAA